MINGLHTVIRTAEPDDAAALKAVYDSETPRSCLLDGRRELIIPTLDELREVMSQKEMGRAIFYTIEDPSGQILGFCSLRGMNSEAQYSEFIVIFPDSATFATPVAGEVYRFLTRQAFERLKLKKVITHCLDCEHEYRKFLMDNHFQSAGVQRDILFSQGRWFNLEALNLRATDVAAAEGAAAETAQ